MCVCRSSLVPHDSEWLTDQEERTSYFMVYVVGVVHLSHVTYYTEKSVYRGKIVTAVEGVKETAKQSLIWKIYIVLNFENKKNNIYLKNIEYIFL